MTKITKKQEALLTELLKDFDCDAEDLLGKHRLVMELKKRGLEAMLEGELTDYLGYEPSHPAGNGGGNSRCCAQVQFSAGSYRNVGFM